MRIRFAKDKLSHGIVMTVVMVFILFLFRGVFTEHIKKDYIMDEASQSLVISDAPLTYYNYVPLIASEERAFLFFPVNDNIREINFTMEYNGEANNGTAIISVYNGAGTILQEETVFLDNMLDVYTVSLKFKKTQPLANEGYLSISFDCPVAGEEMLIRSTISMSYDDLLETDIVRTIFLVVFCILMVFLSIETYKEWIPVAIYSIIPALSYVTFEYVTGNLLNITGKNLAFNLAFFYCFYGIVFFIINRARITAITLNIILYFIAAAEYYVVLFRGRPIMLWDVLAIRTAASVAGNYTYTISPAIFQGAFMLLALTLLLWKFPYKIKDKKKRFIVSAGFLLVVMVYIQGFYSRLIEKYELTINMWDPTSSYSTSGYVLSTFVYINYLRVDKPEGYSIAEVERIQADIKNSEKTEEITTDGIVPTNIICIMNESFSDLSANGDFETNQDYLPFINNLTDNTVKGNLYVPVFGSMTCNSEFEFLTGNTTSFLPPGTIAYQLYLHDTTWSLVSTLKSMDYRTIAMHPYPGINWNRDKVFGYMGFDEFLEGDYFESAERVRGYASDKATYDTIIDLVEEKEEGQPLFIFNITMQNHGGYSGLYDDFESDVFLTEYTDLPQTEEYLSLVKISDEAFEYLLSYFSDIEEPTMIVMFGDHQPSVENEFYEALYGKSLNDLTSEERINQYVTPFMIWTNYEMESETVDKLSASYLSSLVLEKANLPKTDYDSYIADMREVFPVVHPLGYYDAEDKFHKWSDWKSHPDYPVFRDFHILQYNNLFDFRKRVDSIFTLSP